MTDPTLMLQKTAVIYAKTGPAVYHSHHDMIRFWERAVKRADLPVRLTQGFNPRPRIIFPHALGLGIVSRHEEVELELYRPVGAEELLARLRNAAGDTLDILDAIDLPPVKKSRQMHTSEYSISGWPAEARPGLADAVRGILAMDAIQVERGAPGNRRSMDIRPFLRRLEYVVDDGALRLCLIHTLTGSARPDEVAKLAAQATGTDYHDLIIEKTAMHLV